MVNIGMDLNQPRRDLAPTNNPSDDQNNNKVPIVECQHFSMRGFVADIRKKDPKLCYPFSSYISRDGSTDINHELPPMELPKFRWSQCGNSAAPRPRSSSGTSKEAQKPTAEMADASIPFIQEPSKTIDAPKIRSTEASPTYSNDNKNCNPSTISANTKGKGKAHVENELALQTGFENGLAKQSSSQAILQRITDGKHASRSADNEVVRARRVGNEKTTKSHHHKNRKSAGIVIGFRRKRVNREKGYNADEISLMNKQASLEAQRSGAWTNRIRTEVAGIFHGSGSGSSSSGSKAHRFPLPALNVLNVQPTENDDTNVLIAGNNNIVKDADDDYWGADSRKTPSKMRLLSDLSDLKENSNDAKLNKTKPSSSRFPGPSGGSKCTRSDPQAQSPMNEKCKRKRVRFDTAEESKSVEIKGSNNGTKKLRTPHYVVTSESDDEVTEITSEAFAESLSRSSLGKNPLLKKRNHGASSSMSRHKTNIPKSSSHEKGKSCDKGVSSDAVTFKPRVINLPQDIVAVDDDLNDRNDQINVRPSSSGPVIRDGDYAFRTTPGAAPFTGSRYVGNRETNTAPKSNSKGKGVWIPEAEEGGAQSQNSAMQVHEIDINNVRTTIAGDDRGQTHFLGLQRPHQEPYSIRGRAQGQECVPSSSIVGLLAPNNNSLNAHINFRSYFPSYLHAVDFYNRRRGYSPWPNMDPRVWPSVARPSQMPLGITDPEMISQSSSVVRNRGTLGPPAMLNINHGNLSFSSGRAYNAGEQPRSFLGGRDRER